MPGVSVVDGPFAPFDCEAAHVKGVPLVAEKEGPLGVDAFRAFRLVLRSVVARDFVQLTLALPAGVEVRGNPPALSHLRPTSTASFQ